MFTPDTVKGCFPLVSTAGRVEAVHEGTAAAQAGMLPGDRLLSAAGTNFSDLSEDESIQLLR